MALHLNAEMAFTSHSVIHKRIFFPVGQGAFYSEIFYDENNPNKVVGTIVYDCGTESKQSSINNTIYNFKKYGIKDINILFISHFHQDHISHIPMLLNNYNVRIIVLPVISKESIIDAYLSNYIESGQLDNSAINFIEEYIDKKTYKDKHIKIVRINQLRKDDIKRDGEEIKVVSYEEIMNGEIDTIHNSWTSFRFNKWEYIPCNYPSNRAKDLVQEMKKLYPELVNAILKLGWTAAKGELSKIPFDDIKQLYNRVYENRDNEESMILLSRPTYNTKKKSATCLYTGDFPFRNKKCLNYVKTYYQSYWASIGTIQSPHHGSNYDNPRNLHDKNRTQVVCYGSNNGYNHPGKVALINMALTKGSLRMVTEASNTLFVQIIHDTV